jgi:ACR3 family arsenite efflux pump ArsB
MECLQNNNLREWFADLTVFLRGLTKKCVLASILLGIIYGVAFYPFDWIHELFQNQPNTSILLALVTVHTSIIVLLVPVGFDIVTRLTQTVNSTRLGKVFYDEQIIRFLPKFSVINLSLSLATLLTVHGFRSNLIFTTIQIFLVLFAIYTVILLIRFIETIRNYT